MAARKLGRFDLSDCEPLICEPCPMCFSAIYWQDKKGVLWLAFEDAARIGFDDNYMMLSGETNDKGGV